MAQIGYCDDEKVLDGWHPIYGDVCGDPHDEDEWITRKSVSYIVRFEIDAQQQDEREFERLAKRWKRDTAIFGNLSKIIMHEDYQRIMAMGPRVIPYILKDLARKPAHWFWALHNLVPEGQDPAEGLTTIEEARQAWLEWGRKNHSL